MAKVYHAATEGASRPTEIRGELARIMHTIGQKESEKGRKPRGPYDFCSSTRAGEAMQTAPQGTVLLPGFAARASSPSLNLG